VSAPRRWLRRLLLLPALVLAALGLVELALRVIPAFILWTRRPPAEPVAAGDTVLVCMGDSVPYGYGVAVDQSWPAQLQIALHRRGRDDVHIRDVAQPGARADMLLSSQMDVIRQVPASVHLRVIVQVGHNDYALYGGFKRGRDNERIPIPSDMPWWWDLRVARAWRWWRDASRHERAPERTTPEAQATYEEHIQALKAALRVRREDLMLATYLVPGEATGASSPVDAITINDRRQVQLEVNRLVRKTATDLDIPVLDLAWSVPGMPTWDPAWFQDGVHPTAGANRAIADAVADQLYPR